MYFFAIILFQLLSQKLPVGVDYTLYSASPVQNLSPDSKFTPVEFLEIGNIASEFNFFTISDDFWTYSHFLKKLFEGSV